MSVFRPESLIINWGHPLTNGLIWNVAPSLRSRNDLVKNGAATILTSQNWGGNSLAGVNGANSTSTSNGGVYWPYSQLLDMITLKFSLVIFCKIESTTAFSHLMCIPYSNTWSAPYASIHWFRDNTNNVMDLSWANGGNFDACISPVSDFPTDNLPHVLGVSCTATDASSGRTARFFKDGILTGSASTISGGTVDMGNKREVILFNHNSADNGEGTSGQIYFAGIWNRELSDSEMRQLSINPWQIYKNPSFFRADIIAQVASTFFGWRRMKGVGQ